MCCYRHLTLNRRTTFPFVSGYNAVGDDVEDGKQEEANLKNEKKKKDLMMQQMIHIYFLNNVEIKKSFADYKD